MVLVDFSVAQSVSGCERPLCTSRAALLIASFGRLPQSVGCSAGHGITAME